MMERTAEQIQSVFTRLSIAIMSGKLALVATCVLLIAGVFVTAEGCDKTKCPGPIKYYEDLDCKPIYAKEGDCCAVRYNCTNLAGRSADKCYVNDHEYSIGEKLREEDRSSPCDIGCTCSNGYSNVATFSCAIVDCFSQGPKPGCYFKHSPDSCCRGEEVCPESLDEVAKCNVDGKTYMDGEAFYPIEDSQLSCQCMPGYKGENIEPFCKKIKSYCGTELRHGYEIYENCTPAYYSSQMPSTSCAVFFRCQNDNDTVIHSSSEKSEEKTDTSTSEEKSDDMKCKFGNMTMHIGDELNQATDYNSVCLKCVCEVPPIPTCQRLPDEECDITVHPPFQ